MRASRSLWWQSIRRRRAAAAGLFLIVVAAVTSAVAGPLLIRAAQQSALRALLERSQPGRYDLVVSAHQQSDSIPDVGAATSSSAAAAGTVLFTRPDTYARGSEPIAWSDAARHLDHRPGVPTAFLLDCRALHVLAGHCPAGAGDVLMPTGVDDVPGALGQLLTFPGRTVQKQFRVSGYYDRAAAGAVAIAGSGAPSLFMGSNDLSQLASDPEVISRATLRPAALTLDRLSEAVARVAAVRSVSLDQEIITNTSSGVVGLADSQHADRRVSTVLGLLVILPVVLLSWYALVLIMQLIAVVRAPEWALGRLRGLPLRTWIRSLYAEPAALLIAGTVVGVVVGYAVARATASAVLLDGTSLEPWRLPVLIAVAGTVVGAALGIGLAAARGLRVPLAALLQESAEPTRISRSGAAVQLLLLVLAVLAGVQLHTQAQLSVGAANLGLLLPGLLTMILTLLAIRVGTRAVRRRSGRPPHSVGALVLGRRLARAPGLLWRYSLIAVAAALAVFAVQLISLMDRNVALRAGNTVGAHEVLHVRHVTTAHLIDAVHAADPSGRYALAAEELSGTFASGTSRVVAVEVRRLAAVSSWHPGWAGLSDSELVDKLAPQPVPAPVLHGRKVRITFSGTTLATSPYNIDPGAKPPRPDVDLVLARTRDDIWERVGLGPLQPGTHTVTATIPCVHGCIVRQLQFSNGTDTEFSADLTMTSLSTDEQPADTFAARLRDPRDWQNDLALAETGLPVSATLGAGAHGLHITLRDEIGHGVPAILPADDPSPVPVLLARDTQTSPIAGIARHVVGGIGLDGQARPLRVVARAAVLPRTLDDGLLVDLVSLDRLSDPADSQAADEVWLAAGAPDTVLAALRARGLRISSSEQADDVRSVLTSAAPPRTVTADVTLVVLLALLALTALAAGNAVDAGRRRQHLRVLRDAGLAPGTIRRCAVREIALPATLAVLIGTVSALVTLLLAGTRLPLFASAIGPPLDATPDWSSYAISVAVVLVAVVLSAVGLAYAEYRAAERIST